MMFNKLDEWKFVYKFKDEYSIDPKIIDEILWQSWKVTPSKNGFMPYEVHVIGPEQQHYKDAVFDILQAKEMNVNARNPLPNKWPINPCKKSVVTSEYLLIFTPRVEDQPSEWQIHLHNGGCYMDAWYEDHVLSGYQSVVNVEIGLFARIVSALCMEKDIDTNYLISFERKLKYWKKLPFVKMPPCLLMAIGIGDRYRTDELSKEARLWDVRPDYDRIVKYAE